ncbi:eukaryotic translation initiation factor 2alpha kinase [Stylonychia lemnae]|uniref:non-specific serine/threonine protein kinase n=1 Tax=Stylonychia lemnae TaxID=5949 RepID=A0A078AW79_STYLE|nr:eukaryotic translation initiation factor 2alpha kinase [Stylonychia lemnae]|eukprot:CDW86336.1 eukaryotic translation initiation factor 2alpha kinase [Stylonychia lemnae]
MTSNTKIIPGHIQIIKGDKYSNQLSSFTINEKEHSSASPGQFDQFVNRDQNTLYQSKSNADMSKRSTNTVNRRGKKKKSQQQSNNLFQDDEYFGTHFTNEMKSQNRAKKSQLDLSSISKISQQTLQLVQNHSSATNTQLDNSFEARQNEMDILQSIYPDDFTMIEQPDEQNQEDFGLNTYKKGKYQIRVYPHTVEENNFCWIDLMVEYFDCYPAKMPKLTLLKEKSKGITDQNLAEIKSTIDKRAEELAKDKQPIVYEVILEIQDILEVINQHTSNYKRKQLKLQHIPSNVTDQSKQSEISADNNDNLKINDKQGDEEESSYYYDEEDEGTDQQQQKQTPKEEEKSTLEQKNEIDEIGELYKQRIKNQQSMIQDAFEWRNNNNFYGANGPSAFDNFGQDFSQSQNDEDESLSFPAIVQASSQMMQVGQISRYKQDFEEISKIGQGGAGRVFKARHKIDRNIYAIKKVRLFRRDEEENERIKREVTVISRLHNQHIVRYFQAWVECIDDEKEINELDFSDSEVDEEDEDYEQDENSDDEGNFNNGKYESNSDSDYVSRSEEDDEQDYYVEDDNDYEEDSYEDDSGMYISVSNKKGKKRGKKDKQNKKQFKKNQPQYNKDKLNKKKQQNQINRKLFQDNENKNNPKLGKGGKFDPKFKGIQVLYIQMEYCEGNNLRNFIDENPGRTNEDHKWKIFSQIVDALHYLHGLNLIHRDLKPSNIFLDKNNNVKLGDFGLATTHHHHHHNQNSIKNTQSNSSLANNLTQRQKKQMETFQLKIQQQEDSDSSQNNMESVPGQPSFSNQAHSVGIGTPAYMPPEQKKGQGKYNFLADMYSLGLILFEMWVSFQTGIEMDKAFQLLQRQGEIEKEYHQKIPENARKLIIWLTKESPKERPSTIALLQSELMPQKLEGEVFKKFIYSIQNHKTIESIQLMNFLLKRKTPKNMDLTYESYILDQAIQQPLGLTQSSSYSKGYGGLNVMNQDNKNVLSSYTQKEAIAKSILKQTFKKIFILHGAIDIDIPIVAPIQDTATIFVSQRQLKSGTERRLSHNSDGSNGDSNYPTDEQLQSIEIDMQSDIVKYQEQSAIQKQNMQLINQLKERDVQKITYVNIDPQQISQRLIDDTGIVLQLQLNLTANFARFIARKQVPFCKRFHIGKTYKKNQLYQRTNPSEYLEATYDVVQQTTAQNYNSGDEIIHEAEVIKVCDQIAQAYIKEIGSKYKIRVSSSEIIDGILEEGRVRVESRHKVVKILASMIDKQPWPIIKRELLNQGLVSANHIEKIGDLIKIKGSVQQIEQILKNHKTMRKVDRFKKVIEYFKSLRNYLKYFGILEDDQQAANHSSGGGVTGVLIFDFSMILENYLNYYSGLIFRLVVPLSQVEQEQNLFIRQKNKLQQHMESFKSDASKNQGKTSQNTIGQTKSTSVNQLPKLAFNNIGTQNQKPTGSARNTGQLQQYETLAIGGRYDNLVANFQPLDVPIAIGVRFFCYKFIQKMLFQDVSLMIVQKFLQNQKKDQISSFAPLDVYIVSINDMTQEKMELLSELWRNNIRAEAHLGSDFQLSDLTQSLATKNLKFLITFKKAVYANNKKVKVKDFENKTEKDEPREGLVERLKNRLKNHQIM